MNLGEMDALLCNLLGDSTGSSNLWPSALRTDILNEGCQQTALWLPREVLGILEKEKSINTAASQAEYQIESGGGFGLSDFQDAISVELSDGSTMRRCHLTPKEVMGSQNRYLKGSLYQPQASIAALTSDATKRAVRVEPVPTSIIANGLKLIYRATPNVLSQSSHVSVLPPEFHELPVYWAAAVCLARARKEHAMRYWVMWRDEIIMQNAKYGHQAQPPEELAR